MSDKDTTERVPATLHGVILIVQRIAGQQPSVSCIAKGDGATLKSILTNTNVTEAEAYMIRHVELIGAKTVSVMAEGIFEKVS